jgi:serine/threonine protein kinase
MDTERNLLLAAIAYHLDYLDLLQFDAASRAWAADRSRPMGEILRDRGWVDGSAMLEIENCAARKLRRHNDDARTALRETAGFALADTILELDDPASARTEVDTAGGTPLSMRTIPLQAGPDPSYGDRNGSSKPPHSSPSSLRYGLIRLIGQGSLGKVWLVRDNNLNRSVAMKELQPRLARSPEAICRFLVEAQVTGQLEHPNIVPVYELAHRPEDDQAFYTMKFLRGRSLRDAIVEYHEQRRAKRAGRLEFSRLLRTFYGVCSAVGYAHSRGVIHRDLKPENVVLGDFDETQVVDWGLAKVIQPAGPPNCLPDDSGIHVGEDVLAFECQGGLKGTAAYMAPEQAAGLNDLVDDRSDIYGLGAILFEILTGRPPHLGKDLPEVLERIIEGETPHVREVLPTIPRALDAICFKAMAKAREDRYEKAGDLALDLQKYMNDEWVSAYRERPLERATRFARRHKTWTQSVVAALLLVSLVSTVAAVQVSRAHGEAERRYQQARGLADTLLKAVAENLKDVPGAEGAQRALLDEAAKAYLGLVAEKGDDLGARIRANQALLRLAEVRLLLHEGGEAERACKEAELNFDVLTRRFPLNPEPRRWRAESQSLLGRIRNTFDRNSDALEPYRHAIATFEVLLRDDPHNPDLLDLRAATGIGLGIVLQDLGQRERALKSYQEAIAKYDHLIKDADEHPTAAGHPSLDGSTIYRVNRARGLISLATLLDEKARDAPSSTVDEAFQAADNASRRAINDLTILVESKPNAPEYLNQLAAARNNLGLSLKDQRRTKEAEGALTQAIDDFEAFILGRSQPRFVYWMIQARQNLASLKKKSEPKVADDLLRAAVNDSKVLVRRNKDDLEFRETLGDCLYDLGRLREKEPREALTLLDQAIAHRRSLKDSKGSREKLAYSLLYRSVASLDLKDLKGAVRDLEELSTLMTDIADQQFNAACCWSRASDLADDANKGIYVRHALDLLRRALSTDPELVKDIGEPELNPIRNQPGFQEIVNSVKK